MIQVPTRLMAPLFFLLFSSAQAGQIVEQTFTTDTSDNPVRPWRELEREGRVLGVDLSHWTHSLVTDPSKVKRRCEVAQEDYFEDATPKIEWRTVCSAAEVSSVTYVWAKTTLDPEQLVRNYVEYNVFQRWSVASSRPTADVKKLSVDPNKNITYYHATGGVFNENLAVFSVQSSQRDVLFYVIVAIHGDHTFPRMANGLLRSHVEQLWKFTKPLL
jgi:hypothetical protein